MRLPSTPEEEAWLARMGARRAEQSAIERKGSHGTQCRDCKHIVGHDFSDKFNYCGIRRSNHTPNGLAPTKRTNTCPKFEKP